MTDPTPAIPAPAPPPPPFSRDELDRAIRRPLHLLEVVLAGRPRLAATVAGGQDLGRLAAAMLIGSVVFVLPYGAVLAAARFWDIVTLFVGSLAICFPSLVVFSAYLGATVTLAQNLALALVISCAAALFCFGFFPILWFLRATMADDGAVTAEHISIGLLTVSLVAGISQLNRCLFADKVMRDLQSSPALLLLWQVLLVFITYRMGSVLGIL